MASELKWGSTTSRTTGISSQNLTAGANVLGNTIDNSTYKDRCAALDIALACSSAPTANKVLEVYLLYAVNGSNFEDGSASVDPTIVPAGMVAARAVTTGQRVALKNIPLAPFKFKVLLKSELDQDITGNSLTVLCDTYNEELQ